MQTTCFSENQVASVLNRFCPEIEGCGQVTLRDPGLNTVGGQYVVDFVIEVKGNLWMIAVRYLSRPSSLSQMADAEIIRMARVQAANAEIYGAIIVLDGEGFNQRHIIKRLKRMANLFDIICLTYEEIESLCEKGIFAQILSR